MQMTDGTIEIVEQFVDALAGRTSRSPSRDVWLDRLSAVFRVTDFRRGDVVIEHHAVAEDIHFLVDGSLRYQHLVTGSEHGETISSQQSPWMPVGWTALHLRRYRVTAVAETDGSLLSLPLSFIEELEVRDPTLRARLLEFIFRKATTMLWEARGIVRELPSQGDRAPIDLPLAPIPERSALVDMYQQSGSFSALSEDCRQWLADRSLVYLADRGVDVIDEAASGGGLWLLLNGRVSLHFSIETENGRQAAVRYAVRPGTLLCWSSVTEELAAPYGLRPTRSTTLAFVDREALAELGARAPNWLGDIFRQQLWQLRTYLLSTRTHFRDVADDGGIGSLSDLIEDSKPVLPVNSPLYGVPHQLKSKLTRDDGFKRLYDAHFSGSKSERVVASLSLDMLRDLERSHRFFAGLQSTYAAVARNSHLPPGELRKLSSQYFRDALDHVPYVIAGWDNLPDDPNCIFIYNHMAYADDSILPNGFLFNPDSHFVSSMILEPKYGDGMRIARSNAVTEFWRADYYERLGHISVVTPESGWIEETDEEKRRRKERFLSGCQAVLDSGRPFAIAPEGTITEEESVTERSPGPLKSGAFTMSARFPSRPRIVPLALANFDKPAHSAVFSCVIKPSFSMDERGVDVNDRAQMANFLEAYREEFRGHVEEAIAIAREIQTPEADLGRLITNLGRVDVVNEEFEHDVRALELRRDHRHSDTPLTVFYGSSTFRMWDDLERDLGLSSAVNLGFGGSTFEACRLYFERLVLPYEPHRLVVYCGENDISRGETADFVTDQFERFCEMVDTHLPTTDCWFVSIKPAPGRRERMVEIVDANARIASRIESLDRWAFVDWFPYLTDDGGEPNKGMFTRDEVHVNAAGYAVLAKLLRDELSPRR